MISTPFANDFNVIATNSSKHQQIPNKVEKFAKGLNFHLKPTKCKPISISGGYSKVVQFKLSDLHISFIVDSPEKIPGSRITFSVKQCELFEFVNQDLATTLDNVNTSLVRDK